MQYTDSLTARRGFTLVEMIVSVALFSVVMLVSTAALLSLVAANRKAQALESVMNNLNITLDGMLRALRMGSSFHCGAGNYSIPQDCPDQVNGDTVFAFLPYGASVNAPRWVYSFDQGTGRIYKSINNEAPIPITAPEVTIESMRFFVVGSARGCTVSPCDTIQPKVLMVMKGSAPVNNSKLRTTFHIQVASTQRLLDL
jgi:prepilin-type N-terminal cleavage/methylation domain-containing protein